MSTRRTRLEEEWDRTFGPFPLETMRKPKQQEANEIEAMFSGVEIVPGSRHIVTDGLKIVEDSVDGKDWED